MATTMTTDSDKVTAEPPAGRPVGAATPPADRCVHVVVVTYNRKTLLERCLDALLSQTRAPDAILVVDNASTDGTRELLAAHAQAERSTIRVLTLPENRGGAGGFEAGLREAVARGAEYTWVMDDDALPERDALEKLLHHAADDGNLYGSVPTAGDRLAWRLTRTDVRKEPARTLHDIRTAPDLASVQFLPFLGLLVSSALIKRIGLPEGDFFLAADDVEFCMRARRAGGKVIAVKDSRLQHPAADAYFLRLPFKRLWCLRLPPWKRYYDVRNRLFIARRHYGLGLYYKTIPGSVLRLIGTLLYEKGRYRQLRAFYAGMADGLRGRGGRRHQEWQL